MILLQATGLTWTDQGLMALFAIVALAFGGLLNIIRSFEKDFRKYVEEDLRWKGSTQADVAVLRVATDSWRQVMDANLLHRFASASVVSGGSGEDPGSNGSNGQVGEPLLSPTEAALFAKAERVTVRQMTNDELLRMIQALDRAKVRLKSSIEVGDLENRKLIEAHKQLSDAETMLANLNSYLNQRRTYEQVSQTGPAVRPPSQKSLWQRLWST